MQVQGGAVTRSVYTLWEYHFPAETHRDGPLGGRTPFVLSIPEKALLPLLSVRAGAYVTLEAGHIAQQKRREADAVFGATVGRHVLGGPATKGQLTGTMAVAGYAKVLSVAEVRSKLETVLAHCLGDVVNELILRLGLCERAVALVCT